LKEGRVKFTRSTQGRISIKGGASKTLKKKRADKKKKNREEGKGRGVVARVSGVQKESSEKKKQRKTPTEREESRKKKKGLGRLAPVKGDSWERQACQEKLEKKDTRLSPSLRGKQEKSSIDQKKQGGEMTGRKGKPTRRRLHAYHNIHNKENQSFVRNIQGELWQKGARVTQ